MDDEAVKTTGEETPSEDSPSTDNQTTNETEEVKEPVQEEAQEAPEQETKAEPEPEAKPKSENRFQTLANQVREANEQLERERTEKAKILEQLAPSQPTSEQVKFDPNKEYTIEEYNKMLSDAQQIGAAQANLGVEQLRQELTAKEARQSFENNLQSDIGYLEKTYPELDSNSDQYNSVLHREITEAYQEVAVQGEQINPNVSLKSIGDRIMRGGKELANTQVASANQEVAKAASSSVQSDAVSKQSTDIGPEWFRTEYNPNNPDHRRLADEYVARNQFKS